MESGWLMRCMRMVLILWIYYFSSGVLGLSRREERMLVLNIFIKAVIYDI